MSNKPRYITLDSQRYVVESNGDVLRLVDADIGKWSVVSFGSSEHRKVIRALNRRDYDRMRRKELDCTLRRSDTPE